MPAKKKTARRKTSGAAKRTQGKRKPSRQVMEARTKSISFLNRAAFVVLMILICIAVAVTVFPQWGELKKLEEELATTNAEEQEALALVDQKTRELRALRNDQEFPELKARDILNLYRPGETVIRIHRD